MRKSVSLMFLICIVGLLFPLLSLSAQSQTVEGIVDYKGEIIYEEDAHGHKILYALEHEWWAGSFEGKAHAVFIVLVNEAGLKTVDLFSTFTGTVDGKSGSLVIHLIGERPPEKDWAGNWDIVRGTGELTNLRGQGTWGGPGSEGPKPPEPDWDPTGEGNTRPDLWYKGTVSTEDVPEDEAFKEVVEEIFDTWRTSTLNGDFDLWLSIWDENAVKMMSNRPTVSGKSAIGKMKQKMSQARVVKSWDVNIDEIRPAGDFGYARGTYIINGESKADSTSSTLEGTFLTIFKKQADGSWKIYRDCMMAK